MGYWEAARYMVQIGDQRAHWGWYFSILINIWLLLSIFYIQFEKENGISTAFLPNNWEVSFRNFAKYQKGGIFMFLETSARLP